MDFFCSADDRHRVVLLADLLERAGQSVKLRCEPVSAPSRPCLVACTGRALREAWIARLFAGDGPLVAIRLDSTPLPGRCARIIDMQSWPARSADRQVGKLVHWLQHGDDGTGPISSSVGAGAAGRRRADHGRSARSRSPEAGDRIRSALGGLVVIAAMVLLGVLLFLAVPDRAMRRNLVDGPSDAPASSGEPLDDGLIERGEPVPAAGASEPGDHRGDVATGTTADSLTHLCQARSVEAAMAWAGALSWKQRRRLRSEPCVRQLLHRPGFEGLRLDDL